MDLRCTKDSTHAYTFVCVVHNRINAVQEGAGSSRGRRHGFY